MTKNHKVRALLLAAVVLAAMNLTACKKAPTASTGTSGSTAASSTSTSSVATSAPTTQGQAATLPTATPNGGGSKGTTGTAKPGGGSTTTTTSAQSTAIGPFKELPNPGIAAQTVNSPYPAGKKLPPLASAPSDTISALKLGTIPAGSAYKVTLRPYGIGPSLLLGSRLAVKLDKVTPKNGAPANKLIDGANLLVLVDTSHGGTITKGGTYTAWIVFQSDGSKLIPVMSRVSKQ